MPNGFPQGLHGFPGAAPHPNAQLEQLKKVAEQVEETQKKATEIFGKFIEGANQSVDGVKGAVSQPT